MNRPLKEGYSYHSISVDVVIFTIEDGELKVLLIDRAKDPYKGLPALPGGVLRTDESTKEAANRVLWRKAGLKDIYIEQLYTFDDVERDPRGPMLSVTYFALAPYDALHIMPTERTENPRFVSLRRVGTLAFDHNNILKYSIERLRAKIEYSNIAFSLVPRLFTFTELQAVYEIILGKTLDKRNFRKKIERLGLIKKTTKTVTKGRQRPAALYHFTTEVPKTFKNSF